MPFAKIWVQLEINILNEVNQPEKDKYHMISLICVTKKKVIHMNLYKKNRHKLTNIENKLMTNKGERVGRDKLAVYY